MKQLKCAGFIIGALVSHTQVVEAETPYNWSGFYAGINTGLIKHTLDVTDLGASTFNATIVQAADPNFSGGFQLGIRKQLDPNKISGVFGLEFNANFSNASLSQSYGTPFALYQLSAENKLKNVHLVQFMAGIGADKTLLFLAAGFSWTYITGGVVNLDGLPFFHSLSLGKRALGTGLGAGVEYAYNEHISVRLKVDVIGSNAYTTFDDTESPYEVSSNAVQGTLGVNYKFG